MAASCNTSRRLYQQACGEWGEETGTAVWGIASDAARIKLCFVTTRIVCSNLLLCLLDVVTHRVQSPSRWRVARPFSSTSSSSSSSSFAQKHFILGAHAINSLAAALFAKSWRFPWRREQKFQMSLCTRATNTLHPPFTHFHQRESIALVFVSRHAAPSLTTRRQVRLRIAWCEKRACVRARANKEPRDN